MRAKITRVLGTRRRKERPRPGAPATRRTTGERGAVALEFALVMPIFLLLVMGIIDYGLWFNDSNSARQGVREAARMAVVQNYAGTACTAGSTPVQKSNCLADLVKDEVAAISGPTYVRIIAPETWEAHEALIVCTAVTDAGVIGLVPLPNDEVITARTRMSVEVADADGPSTSTSPGAPGSIEWDSWCK